MEACAPCGIHRTGKKTHLRFESVSHDAISNDLRFSAWAEDDAIDELTVDECLHRLTEQERRIVLMLLDGVRPGEVAKRLNMPRTTYQYRIIGIRKKLRVE
jgi:DNA-directed RNA polymerase specialized sigma24 family protein